MASKKAQASFSKNVASRATANRGANAVGMLVAPLARETGDSLPVDAAYQDVVTPSLDRLLYENAEKGAKVAKEIKKQVNEITELA